MRIDVHAHYFPPEYTDCLRRLGDPRAESRDAVPGDPPIPFDGDARPLLRRLWYDTVNAHRAALRCACESFGADRLLLGTDFPYMQDAQLQYLLDVPHEIGLSDAEVAALLGGTAQTLLGLPAR